jgi:tRNA nucleotidyltransferase (CCA-adding enzyme)
MTDWEQIRLEVLHELKPSRVEEAQLMAFAEETAEKINKVLREKGINASAEIHGSVAHGTWISGQQDLDVFLVIEEYSGREQLQEALDAVRAGTGWSFTEAYAEHPYLKTKINDYSLDVVPCFRVKEGEGLHSSTDRTPLHTGWLNDRLNGLDDEVLLLKKFLMTLDLYGAEIRIGGFSGYLCELLVVHYGGFWELIKAASKWGKHTIISFSDDEPKKFNDSLTVIDPVDRDRNVASALREDSYSMFIAACRDFKRKPSLRFFRKEEIDVAPEMIIEELSSRPTDILFLVIEESSAEVADVLWGQIHKSRQALERQISKNGFNVLRASAWSNEETRHILIYELESGKIHETVKRMGPPARLEGDVMRFIEKHRDNPRTVAGPDLFEDRWYILVKRDYTDIRDLMDRLLSDGGRDIGVSRKLAVRILQHHRVLLNGEIEDYLTGGFEDYLYEWLKGRPLWVE